MRTRLRLTILMFFILVAPGTVHGRAWMLQDGTRIDGKFIDMNGNNVRLGVRREFKLYLFSRFSVTDQEWIRFHHGLNKLEKDRLREEINERPERVWTLKNGQQWTGRFLRVFKAELPNGAVVSHVTIYPPIQSFPFRDLVQKDQTYVEQVLEDLGIKEILGGRIRDKEEENQPGQGPNPAPFPNPNPESDPDLTPSDPEHDYSPLPGTTLVPVPYDPRGDKPDDGKRNQDPPEPSRPDTDRPPSYSDEQPQPNLPPEKPPQNENSLKDDIMEGNYKDLPTRHGGQLALIIAIVVGALVLLKVLRG